MLVIPFCLNPEHLFNNLVIDGVSIADFSTELHSFTKFGEQFCSLLGSARSQSAISTILIDGVSHAEFSA
ncbi:hypothetical protein ACS7WQ_03055 [Staphylococcus felis]|uniref:hypothetical protein n=1 Tax=Staphylococcus felis TaxID=46127 RepID=UPI003F43DB7B